MTSPLDSTFSVWLISLFLETMLYGMGVLQVWLYFHWYPKDSPNIKAVVVLLLYAKGGFICTASHNDFHRVLETLQISFLFSATYKSLIENFGNFSALTVIRWEDSAQLLSGYISAFIVQLYFAYCLYALNKTWKNHIAVILIISLAITQIGAGIAQTVITTELGDFTKLASSKNTTSIQSGATLACDILITVSLCLTFNEIKTGMRTTNTMIHMLTVNAINRGILTAICAALNLILFLAIPNTFYFFLGLMLSIYMNSMLATLNTRQHIVESATMVPPTWNSILTSIDFGQDAPSLNSSGQKNTFLGGMI
ncbi:hypothetical protein BDZ94DRAFT_1306339 [Collybia nuda]|uniref:DUF6534 domain-containing protein n=1 Tax=Collybia nuda TaxID=64659 RepID=A0A9P5YCI5_9AGAR|nr:hypothetical protein BDZ94DRAFT_1306339 [Collybia nuda]